MGALPAGCSVEPRGSFSPPPGVLGAKDPALMFLLNYSGMGREKDIVGFVDTSGSGGICFRVYVIYFYYY